MTLIYWIFVVVDADGYAFENGKYKLYNINKVVAQYISVSAISMTPYMNSSFLLTIAFLL